MSNRNGLDRSLSNAYERNRRVNAAVLQAVSMEDMSASDGAGGWSVGRHLGHLADFRWDWLRYISPEHAEGLSSVLEGYGTESRLAISSVAELGRAFEQGDDAALVAVQDALAQGRAFQGAYESDPGNFLVHTIVHDAHHRGQVLSLLRRNGRTATQMDELDGETWPIWRE